MQRIRAHLPLILTRLANDRRQARLGGAKGRHPHGIDNERITNICHAHKTQNAQLSAGRFLLNSRSCLIRVIPALLVAGDDAVLYVNDTVRVLRNIVFVGHQDDGVAFGLQSVKQRHDLDAGL